MKAVYTELHRSHDPQFFLVRGVIQRTTEQPERADRLLAGLKAGKHDLIAPTIFGQGPRARVHSPEYLRFLEEAWDAWTALGDAGPEMIANMADNLAVAANDLALRDIGEGDLVALRDLLDQAQAAGEFGARPQSAAVGDNRDVVVPVHADVERFHRDGRHLKSFSIASTA